jgi:hypothetical protein
MLRFSQGLLHDESRMVVRFVAHADAQQIDCAISDEALDDHFGDSRRGRHVDAFRQHRPAIERVTQRLIERKRTQWFNLDPPRGFLMAAS